MEESLVQTLDRLQGQGRLKELAISETGFSFDPRTGQSFSLNETALFAINKFIEGHDPGSTAKECSQEFEVEEELALSAVEVFIRQLGRYLK